MKKVGLPILILLSVVLLFIFYTSNREPQITNDDFYMIDNTTKEKIGLGMSRSEVEQILGVSSEVDPFHFYDYGSLRAAYRDDEAAALYLSKDNAERFETNRGIGIGASLSELIRSYGEFLKEGDLERKPYTIEIMVEEKQTGYQLMDADDQINHNNDERILMLHFWIDWNKETITSIMITDYKYAVTFK